MIASWITAEEDLTVTPHLRQMQGLSSLSRLTGLLELTCTGRYLSGNLFEHLKVLEHVMREAATQNLQEPIILS